MLKGRFRTTNCGSESSFTQGPINQDPDIRLTEEKRFQPNLGLFWLACKIEDESQAGRTPDDAPGGWISKLTCLSLGSVSSSLFVNFGLSSFSSA
ncbi:Gustatory receptor for sugar taste 64f [Trichinella spiralis]|uniref:Gustatory receptor for sugar taste 64f n=1 Tax=Trichinella spiralis TaxID=6334 RepID=A0ABR3KBK3_TRISP